MDKAELGRRVAQAREHRDMTQAGLGRAVDLDRTAISRLEKGARKLNVAELVEIASALDRPLSYFVSESVPAVVNRRSDAAHAHATTGLLDTELDQFASDVRTLLSMGLLDAVNRPTTARVPRDHRAAEDAAAHARAHAGLGTDPLDELGQACERLGLFTFSVHLGEGAADGGCVEVEHGGAAVGVAVVNGDAPPARRRMTLAHELGHWLFGDAYDSRASISSEKMINSFAIHFLAPRAGVTKVWEQHASWDTRDRALAVGAAFKLSWSAMLGQLNNVDLISRRDFSSLGADEPRHGEYLRLGLRWVDELAAPYVSPTVVSAMLNGYTGERLTASRTIELLRGTLAADELPQPSRRTIEELRPSFAGHDG